MDARPRTTLPTLFNLTRSRFQAQSARRDVKNKGASGDVCENKGGHVQDQHHAVAHGGCPSSTELEWGRAAVRLARRRRFELPHSGAVRCSTADIGPHVCASRVKMLKMKVHPAMCMKTKEGMFWTSTTPSPTAGVPPRPTSSGGGQPSGWRGEGGVETPQSKVLRTTGGKCRSLGPTKSVGPQDDISGVRVCGKRAARTGRLCSPCVFRSHDRV